MIIVGAGIIGLSCAWRLAQRGINVQIFDAKKAASDASWAAAGMLSPESEGVGELGMRSAKAWPAFAAELEREAGIDIDYVPFGAEAIVDPRAVTRALLTVCRKLGVELHENEPVMKIGNAPTLIAAGARSSELYPGLPKTFPVRGQLLGWRLEPGALRGILHEGHTYVFQRSSGLVVAGSTTEHVGWDDRVNPAAIADVHSRAAKLFPRLANLEPDEKWIGFRPGIEADGPMIGQIPGTNVWAAFGHYRNGILLAPETARIIAEQIHT
jgi:glycine oxidase